ncbi:hypothetical protein AK812_SmicGene14443 [Symbiodinium microadriaticum]|uniref:Uncharacterized protein n=1 Tax=Symbiodinium microadriaticum TaxID=2951 RepID=A0A1Q9E5G9_SYMMI|nr:hypothetical protein AK812_SmicGene14443 [Symbiodinium microadriaticum]CAE7892438.1 unnamed protein product [Symbiodinium microadriaticum]CAE7947904.1 unnamed protein product [Symbiodinium sp. KB8]
MGRGILELLEVGRGILELAEVDHISGLRSTTAGTRAAMLGELREENQRLRADMAQCRDSEAAAKQEASELRKQVKDLEDERSKTLHSHGVALERLSTRLSEVQGEHKAEVSGLQRKMDILERLHKESSKECAKLKDDRQAEYDLRELETANKSLAAELKTKERERMNLKSELFEVKKEVKELKRANSKKS